jgi:hypothetical protein
MLLYVTSIEGVLLPLARVSFEYERDRDFDQSGSLASGRWSGTIDTVERYRFA